jgi:hypothetical protein
VLTCSRRDAAIYDHEFLLFARGRPPRAFKLLMSKSWDWNDMKIEGSCHCGKIGYEAEIDPEYVIICHCADCQTISGAPYRTVVPVKAENFKMRGQPKTYAKTADSGNKMALSFCGDCGAALYSSALEEPLVFNLRLGAVKQRAQLAPKAQYWCRSAMQWAMDISRLPQSPDQTQPLRCVETD